MPAKLSCAIKVILSVIMGLITFISVCMLIGIMLVRSVNVTDLIKSIDIATIIEETGIYENIVDEINDILQENLDIKVQDLENFVKLDAVTDEIGRIVDGYLTAFAEGDLDHHITSGDLADFARVLAPDVSELFNYELTEKDYDNIIRVAEEHIDFSILSIGSILDEANIETSAVSTINIMFSVYLPLSVFTFCVLIIFNILLFHRKKIEYGFLTAGIPMILSGFAFLIAGFFLSYLVFMVSGLLYSLAMFLSGLTSRIMIYGIICAAAGISSVIACAVIASRRKKWPVSINAEDKTKTWILTGLLGNFVLIATCVFFTVMFLQSHIT